MCDTQRRYIYICGCIQLWRRFLLCYNLRKKRDQGKKIMYVYSLWHTRRDEYFVASMASVRPSLARLNISFETRSTHTKKKCRQRPWLLVLNFRKKKYSKMLAWCRFFLCLIISYSILSLFFLVVFTCLCSRLWQHT